MQNPLFWRFLEERAAQTLHRSQKEKNTPPLEPPVSPAVPEEAFSFQAGIPRHCYICFIAESVVLSLVSDTLRAIADYAKTDWTAFIRTVQEAQVNQQDSGIKKKRRRSGPGSWNGLCARFTKMYVVKGKADGLVKYNIAAAHLWQKWHKQL